MIVVYVCSWLLSCCDLFVCWLLCGVVFFVVQVVGGVVYVLFVICSCVFAWGWFVAVLVTKTW